MLSYGLSNIRIVPRAMEPIEVVGAVSIEESSTPPELQPVYFDGILIDINISTPKSYSAKLSVYSEFEPPERTATVVYRYYKHGKRAIGVLLNAKINKLSDTFDTLDTAPKPARVSYEIQTNMSVIKGRPTSHLLFEERLMGEDNFNDIEDYLYRQNDIRFEDEATLDRLDLTVRDFRVIYNVSGYWEVSGPSKKIRNHKDGIWEIDDIRNINVNEDEFILIDDYEE